MNLIFWLLIFILIWPYVFYPFLLFIVKGFCKPKLGNKYEKQNISIIIPCYNEEKIIQSKIDNLISCLPEKYNFKIYIISDGSSDNTYDIAKKNSKNLNNFNVYDFERSGKSQVINKILKIIVDEILIFTDANVLFNKNTIVELISVLSYEKVGCVGATVIYSNPNNIISGEGESAYWKFENYLKTLESSIGYSSGVSGAAYAVKKNLFKPFSLDVINDDFTIATEVSLQGKYVLINPKALVFENVALSVADEFNRHIRDSAGHFQVLSFFTNKINFFKNPILFFVFYSHRLLRWIGPFLLISLFLINLLLVFYDKSLLFKGLFCVQLIFYLFGMFYWFYLKQNKINKFLLIPIYFLNLNMALAIGFFSFLKKKNYTKWESTGR
jgi:biofilm PGA synthesis N-glycosyltransferase PgaC